MIKTRRIFIILAGIFLTIGIGMVAVTGVLGIKNGLSILPNMDANYESEEYSMNGETINLDNSNINAIELTGNYGKVEFIKGDHFAYQIIGTESNTSMFTHDVTNNVWKINIKNRSGFYFFGFGTDDHISKLRITVPSTVLLDHVTVKLSAGSVDVERLAAKNLKMEMGAGSLRADELIGEDYLRLTVSAGQCKVKNIIGANPSIKCDAGQISAKGVLTGKGDINCSVGEIDLDLVGNSFDYDYNVSCGVGAIKVNGSQVGGIATKNSKNTGAKNKFSLDCGIGQINLDFVE